MAVLSISDHVMLVWQSCARNEWATAIPAALNAPDKQDSAAWDPGLFSLAETEVVEAILQKAGFTEIGFSDVHEPLYYGPDVDTACHIVCSFKTTRDLLARLDAGAAERALEQLRSLLVDHLTADGVFFDSRAWIVTARRFA